MTDRHIAADLLVTANRVFSADLGLDGPGAVAVREGRIVAAGADVAETTTATSWPAATSRLWWP